MRLATWLCRAGLLGAFAITLCTIATASADEPKPADDAQVERRRVVRPRPVLINDIGAASKYWLVVNLDRVPAALDEQLQLGGKGVLVTKVGADGPAAKAGLKVHDIVLAVGDKPIQKFAEIAAEIDKAEGKEIALKILRAGKEMSLAITPVQRPASGNSEWELKTDILTLPRLGNFDIDIEEIEEKISEKLKDAGVDVRMLLIEPGKFIPRGAGFEVEKPADFPDDLNVEIIKHGKEPAQIEVKQGDKTWTVTEEKLDELPENIRGHVKGLLGRSSTRFTLGLQGGKKFSVPLPAPGGTEPPAAAPNPAENSEVEDVIVKRKIQARERIRGSLEHRLDEMNRDLSRMRERMDSLRDSLRELDRADKPNDDR